MMHALAVTIAINAMAVTSAAVVLFVTVQKTLSQVRYSSSLGINTSLSRTLLRDGTFGVNRYYLSTDH